MSFVKYYVHLLIYIELIISLGTKVFPHIKQFFKEFKKHTIINSTMCLDHTTNWKLKPHINYKIYYAQYLWSPPPKKKNTLNSDNTVMHFSYIDRLKITDNIKIKYHI